MKKLFRLLTVLTLSVPCFSQGVEEFSVTDVQDLSQLAAGYIQVRIPDCRKTFGCSSEPDNTGLCYIEVNGVSYSTRNGINSCGKALRLQDQICSNYKYFGGGQAVCLVN